MQSHNERILELEFANHKLRQELTAVERKYVALRKRQGADYSVSKRAAQPPQQTLVGVLREGHPYRVEA